MSTVAMTTLGQLQQLNDAQLSIMCHNYRIAHGYITAQNRRHLERKLHVAIIAESAQQRALDYIAREKDEEYQRDLYARSRGSNILPPRPRSYARSPSPETYEFGGGTQNAWTMTTPSVHRIGGIRTQWPSPLPYTTRRTYEPQRAPPEPSILSSALARAPGLLASLARELPLMIWRGLEGHLFPQLQRFRGGEQESLQDIEPYHAPQEDTNRSEALAQQLNNTYEEQTPSYPYGLDYEELQQYTQQAANEDDIEADIENTSAVGPDKPVENDSFTSLISSIDEFVEEKTVTKAMPKEQPVRSAFKFVWWRSPEKETPHLPEAIETDRISDNEQELNTFEYLNEEQKLEEQRKEVKDIMGRTELRDDSDDEVLTTLPTRRRRILGSCGAFCRSIYEFLCCDREGVWDADKVRCTVFCCGMLVFVGVSFRKLR